MPSGYEEKKHLTLTVTGHRMGESWTQTQKPSDFFLFKGYVNLIFSRLGLEAKLKVQPAVNDIFAEGISYTIGNEILAEFGSLKKSVLKEFDVKQEVFFADFNWDALIRLVSAKIKYTEISKFPEVRRDLALLVDSGITFENIY